MFVYHKRYIFNNEDSIKLLRPVRLAYQPPTSHQPLVSSIFLVTRMAKDGGAVHPGSIPRNCTCVSYRGNLIPQQTHTCVVVERRMPLPIVCCCKKNLLVCPTPKHRSKTSLISRVLQCRYVWVGQGFRDFFRPVWEGLLINTTSPSTRATTRG
jgi:hypothetical protein